MPSLRTLQYILAWISIRLLTHYKLSEHSDILYSVRSWSIHEYCDNFALAALSPRPPSRILHTEQRIHAPYIQQSIGTGNRGSILLRVRRSPDAGLDTRKKSFEVFSELQGISLHKHTHSFEIRPCISDSLSRHSAKHHNTTLSRTHLAAMSHSRTCSYAITSHCACLPIIPALFGNAHKPLRPLSLTTTHGQVRTCTTSAQTPCNPR